MEIFQNNNNLITIIIFLIPGFISMKIYEINTSSAPQDFSKSIIEVISHSCLIYTILIPILMVLWNQEIIPTNNPYILTSGGLALLFIIPAVLSITWARLRKSSCIRKFLPHPIGQAWDYIFSKQEPLFVIVTLNSGVKIAGAYSTNSFASSGHLKEQIYIESRWELDCNDNFIEEYKNSRGVLLDFSSVQSIEFIAPEE